MIIKFNVVGAGVVELVADHVVCEEGKPLSPEAAQILVWFSLPRKAFPC
jgi:hypothetical protein